MVSCATVDTSRYRLRMAHEIPPDLVQQARRQLNHPRLQKLLREQLGAADSSGAPVSTELHPACQMLEHSLRAHRDATLAVTQYFAVALQQYHAAAEFIERLERTRPAPRILDFACGYGRLLNLLIHRVPPEQIWAAEIQPEAVEFAARRFGVRALASTATPEEFDPGTRFDLIWVASLFSHLPPGLFQRWLERLAGLLSPDGVMLFTVHDEALLPDSMTMPESGVLFIDGSENRDLSTEIYGTTFVTEDYVRDAIGAALGPDYPFVRLPRLIAYEQDAYLVGGSTDRDLTEFADIPRGLRGWLDERRIDEHGVLELAGWAAAMDRDDPVAVEIRLDDRRRECVTGEPRPRVAEVLEKPGLSHCGFSCRIALPGDRPECYLRITAHDDRGQRALIYAGALDNPRAGEASPAPSTRTETAGDESPG